MTGGPGFGDPIPTEVSGGEEAGGPVIEAQPEVLDALPEEADSSGAGGRLGGSRGQDNTVVPAAPVAIDVSATTDPQRDQGSSATGQSEETHQEARAKEAEEEAAAEAEAEAQPESASESAAPETTTDSDSSDSS